MDVRMPDLDGVAVLKAIRAQFRGRVILWTSFDTDEDIYRGMQAGAMGYLLKDASPQTLLEAIRRVPAGCKAAPPEIGAKLAERVAAGEPTERELEVLRELAQDKSNQEIAAALFITEAAVKFHVNRLLSKLEAQDRTQAVLAALKRGLVQLA